MLKKFIKYIFFKFSEKSIFNTGLAIANINANKKKIHSFKDIEFSSFSQNGEDGILDWLIDSIKLNERLNFIEFGCGDFMECNTRFLLKKRNWKGLLLDCEKSNTKIIIQDSMFWKYDIRVINKKLDKNNINKILKDNNFIKDIGVLSLDIDGNDYWVLNELKFKPAIMVCEYNGIFGDNYQLTVPYDINFERTKKHYSNLFFGASIFALIENLKKKNYFFVGTDSRGVNAFFVEKKYFKIISNKINNILIYAPTHRESRDVNYKQTFVDWPNQIKLIKEKEVFDIKKNKNIFIKNIIKDIYSESFIRKKFTVYKKN
jgi:hypothetical protein